MKKKANKTNSKKDIVVELKGEFKSHTTALMEHMTKEVKTVAEQYGGIAKTLDEIKNDVNDLKNDMAIVKPVVERNSKDIKEMKSGLHSVSMAVMDTGRIVDKIDKKLAENLENHEKRITKLEEKVLT